jgi:hypothetical protein
VRTSSSSASYRAISFRQPSKKTCPSRVGTSGRFDLSMSCTPSRPSNWLTTWLAPDCEMSFSSAAREKLRRATMSQKTFRDFRFMEVRTSAAQRTGTESNRILPDEKNK